MLFQVLADLLRKLFPFHTSAAQGFQLGSHSLAVGCGTEINDDGGREYDYS